MPELKQLGDYYDPMESGLKVMSVLNQQEQIATQRQQVAQQGRNLEIDNAMNQFKLDLAENPMAAFGSYNRLLALQGRPPIKDVAAFIAQPQEFFDQANATIGTPAYAAATERIDNMGATQKKRGFEEFQRESSRIGTGKLLKQAGQSDDPMTTQAVLGSEQLQGQLAKRLLDPQQAERARQIKAINDEHEQAVAGFKAGLDPLIPAVRRAKTALEDMAPQVQALDEIDTQREMLVRSLGRDKSVKQIDELVQANPDLSAFVNQVKGSRQDVEKEIQRLKGVRDADQVKLEQLTDGLIANDGSVTTLMLENKIASTELLLRLQQAKLAAAKDPLNPVSYENIHAAADAIEARLQSLREKKTTAQTIAQSRLDATIAANLAKEQHDNAVAKATQLFGALPKEQQTTQRASKIAQEVSRDAGVTVNVNDVLIKEPNRPPISVELKQANTISEGLGKQYLTLQEGSMSSSVKLAKLDRLDTMLDKIETGKFTPAMTEIQSAAESLGFSVDKSLPIKQAFEALSGEIALGLRNPSGGAGMPGALSDKDLSFLLSMTPGLAKTKDGNKLIIQTSKKLEQRSQVVARLAREYRASHGGNFDEGFYDVLQQYSEKHPLFTDADMGLVKQSGEPMPGPSYDAVKPGELYTAPDGSVRRKK